MVPSASWPTPWSWSRSMGLCRPRRHATHRPEAGAAARAAGLGCACCVAVDERFDLSQCCRPCDKCAQACALLAQSGRTARQFGGRRLLPPSADGPSARLKILTGVVATSQAIQGMVTPARLGSVTERPRDHQLAAVSIVTSVTRCGVITKIFAPMPRSCESRGKSYLGKTAI